MFLRLALSVLGAIAVGILSVRSKPLPKNLICIDPKDCNRLMRWLFENLNDPCAWVLGDVFEEINQRHLLVLQERPCPEDDFPFSFEVSFDPQERERFLKAIAACDFRDDPWDQQILIGKSLLLSSSDKMDPIYIDLGYFGEAKVAQAVAQGIFSILG